MDPKEKDNTEATNNEGTKPEFTEEQQAYIDNLVKETINTSNSELENIKKQYADLAEKNKSLNNQMISDMFVREGISLNETQLNFITSVVKDMTVENMEKIKSTAFELLNRKVDFKKETKTEDENKNESSNPIGDPLGLLE